MQTSHVPQQARHTVMDSYISATEQDSARFLPHHVNLAHPCSYAAHAAISRTRLGTRCCHSPMRSPSGSALTVAAACRFPGSTPPPATTQTQTPATKEFMCKLQNLDTSPGSAPPPATTQTRTPAITGFRCKLQNLDTSPGSAPPPATTQTRTPVISPTGSVMLH